MAERLKDIFKVSATKKKEKAAQESLLKKWESNTDIIAVLDNLHGLEGEKFTSEVTKVKWDTVEQGKEKKPEMQFGLVFKAKDAQGLEQTEVLLLHYSETEYGDEVYNIGTSSADPVLASGRGQALALVSQFVSDVEQKYGLTDLNALKDERARSYQEAPSTSRPEAR